jgi:hypothetical protein
MSPHLERHRSKYTDLLLRVSQKGDFVSWIEFFLESVEGSADESTARAEALLELREPIIASFILRARALFF